MFQVHAHWHLTVVYKYEYDSHTTGTSEFCDCGMAAETIEHF